MHFRRVILTCIALCILASCATPAANPLPTRSSLRLVTVERPKEGGSKGVFSFTNTTGRPLKVFGFDSPDDGEMELRFTEYEYLTPQGWKSLGISYCGTGAEAFDVLPGRTIRVTEWLDMYRQFRAPPEASIGRISLPAYPFKPVIWSEPFNFAAALAKSRSTGR
jgi:hypothetical protein